MIAWRRASWSRRSSPARRSSSRRWASSSPRSPGVLNLGVEGMMLCGAVSAFVGRRDHRQPLARRRAPGCWRARCWRSSSRVLALSFKANQVAVGPRAVDLRRRPQRLHRQAYVGQAIVLRAIGAERRRSATSRSSAPLLGQCIRWSSSRGCCSPRSRGSSIAPARGSCCARSASRRARRTRIGYPVDPHPLSRDAVRRRDGGRRRRLPLAGLHPAVGRGHDRRPRLDRARARRVRDLAAGARAARRLPVRRRHDRAALRAGRGRRRADRAHVDAAVPRDDRRAGDHLARRAR